MASKGVVTENLQNSVASPAKQEDPVDNYETQGHLRTLQDAHSIINDPDKMAKVHKLAGRNMKALAGIKKVGVGEAGAEAPQMKSLDQVSKYAQDKYGGPGGGPKGKKPAMSLAALKTPPDDGE